MKSIKLIAILTLFAACAAAQTNTTIAEVKAQSDSVLGPWEVVKVENLETNKSQEFAKGNRDLVIVSASTGGYIVIFKPFRGNLLRTELQGYNIEQVIGAFGTYKSGELESLSKDTFTILIKKKSETSRVTFQRLAT